MDVAGGRFSAWRAGGIPSVAANLAATSPGRARLRIWRRSSAYASPMPAATPTRARHPRDPGVARTSLDHQHGDLHGWRRIGSKASGGIDASERFSLWRLETEFKQMAHRLRMRFLSHGLRPSVNAFRQIGRQSDSLHGGFPICRSARLFAQYGFRHGHAYRFFASDGSGAKGCLPEASSQEDGCEFSSPIKRCTFSPWSASRIHV